jgi:hypothetical protein
MPTLEDLTPEVKDELAQLARDLSENPETRETFLRMTKKVRPNVTIDAIDLKDEVSKVVEESNKRVEILENRLREKEAVEDLERRRRTLMSKGKAKSDEEIAEIEKVMLEKGITDHETAADYHAWMKQAAKPTAVRTFNQNVLDDTARGALDKFWKNPVGAARDEASRALTELRRNPRPIGL